MHIIGDVHGEFDKYFTLIRGKNSGGTGQRIECSLQVGDMGIFCESDAERLASLDGRHRFIRGNHDNPAICRDMPTYLGDAGFHPEIGLFWVSGGFSIDRDMRTQNFDWWEDEELSYDELSLLIPQFLECRPRYMVTHECPTSAKQHLLRRGSSSNACSRTEQTLQAMWEGHQPEVWIFGHHHKRVDAPLLSTRFVGLGEMKYGRVEDCIFELPALRWPD